MLPSPHNNKDLYYVISYNIIFQDLEMILLVKILNLVETNQIKANKNIKKSHDYGRTRQYKRYRLFLQLGDQIYHRCRAHNGTHAILSQ